MAESPLHQRNCLIFRGLGHVAQTAAIRFRMLVMLLFIVTPGFADDLRDAPPKPFKPVIGSKFEEALNQPLGLTWTDESLRTGLRKLSETRQISILLDRRVDPETKVSIDLQRTPLRDILGQLCEQTGLGLSVVGNTIYIGPNSTTRRLRTVIELQSDQLLGGVNSPRKPPLALLQRRSVQWADLDRPADIVQRISELFGFKVSNLALVPHDLWPSGNIPNASPTEMLLLVTAQFDLSIEWQPQGASVQIVPMPDSASIERRYELKTKPAEIATAWQNEFPTIRTSVKGSQVLVSATVEEHEALAASLRAPRTTPTKPSLATSGTKAVTFTFEIKSAPLLAIMQAVESKSSFVFAYDADELKAAGVDLTRRLDLKMTKASPADLFHAIFDDSRIAFEFDGHTVRLKPQQKR